MIQPAARPYLMPLALASIAIAAFFLLIRVEELWSFILLHYHFENLLFIDWYAITTASDAHSEGYPVYEFIRYDIFFRPHVYSGLWLNLHHLGINRENGYIVAFAFVLCFIIVIAFLIRPSKLWQLFLGLTIILSPPFLLGMERANNDLIIFLIIALMPVAYRYRSVGIYLSAVLIAAATVLKYYPIVAFPVIFALYGVNYRTIVSVLLCATASILQILLAGELLGPLQSSIPQPNYYFTFGGVNIFKNFFFEADAAKYLNIVTFVIIGSLLSFYWARIRIRERREALASLGAKESFYILGALIVIGCFILKPGFSYRLIFCTFSVPLIFGYAAGELKPFRYAARFWLLLLLVVSYIEPITYNCINFYSMAYGSAGISFVLSNLYRVIGVLQWAFIGIYLFIAIELIFRMITFERAPRLLQGIR